MEQIALRMSELEHSSATDSTAIRHQLIDLMDRYQQPLSNYVTMMVRDHDLALDCVQDTFLRAYQHLQKGKPISSGWLWTVARNRALDEIKRRNRIRSDYDGWDEMQDTTLAETDRTHAVRRALAQLPDEDREILHLFIVDRFQAKEIGAMLKIRPEAVRMRIMRARKRFRAIYGDEP